MSESSQLKKGAPPSAQHVFVQHTVHRRRNARLVVMPRPWPREAVTKGKGSKLAAQMIRMRLARLCCLEGKLQQHNLSTHRHRSRKIETDEASTHTKNQAA